MPLLLDVAVNGPMEVDMDDLFGDGVELPPSKPLVQRVDEMRNSGCCRGIAWSPGGTLATVSQDGRSVELRFLRSHPDTGDWGLSEPTVYSPWDHLPQGSSLVHLSWSPAASPELAIVDSFGRILIAVFNSAANRPMLLRKWESDPLDDMHSVVGSYALMTPMPNKQKLAFTYGPAQRKGSNITYPVTYVPHMGPNHVFPAKSAFVFVTTNGTLKVLWSQLNNRYEEKTLELESISSGDDSITHASICSDRGTLLVALATASKQLRVVRVNVTWSTSAQQDKQHPPQIQLRLEEKHIAVTSWLQTGSEGSPLGPSMAQISHIEIIPSACENMQLNKWAHPLVFVSRTYAPPIGGSYTQDKLTMIDRWEVSIEQPHILHSAFSQVASKRGGAGPPTPTTSRLRKLESTVFDSKILLDVSLTQHGNVTILVFSDGSVQYRESATFNELYQEPTSDGLSSLNEIGFTFPEETPCLQAAFSPTRLSFAQICEDGKVKWNLLQYPGGDIGSSMNDTMYASVIAVLATCISNSSLLNHSFDDVLAVARKYTDTERFYQDFSMEVIKCLRVTVDYAEESHHDKLLSNNHVVICCGVMAHLDFHGYFKPRSFTNKLATITLHTKNIILSITMASNAYTQHNTAQRGVTPLDDPYIVDVLTGCGEWIRDLISWIIDGLYCLLDDLQFMSLLQQEKTMQEMVKYLISRADVSLHLCLCSMTRVLLAAACRRLEHLQTVSTRAMTHFERPSSKGETRASISLRQAYKRMHLALSESLVKWADFEKLLGTLGSEIQTAYKTELATIHKTGQAQSSDDTIKKARTQCELLLLLGLGPPSYFQPIIDKFFKTHLQQFRLGTKPSALFFADYSLVEMANDDEPSLWERKQMGVFVDTFKRNKITHPVAAMKHRRRMKVAAGGGGAEAAAQLQNQQDQMPWRRCTRCACVMVDVQVNRQNIQYMLSQLKKCACGGTWGILPKESVVF
ncbi:mediator of rna polymerase ii transcription subunit 16 [Zalerion maritima]|uniref:Mediator of RNA polymerase II transcription subunit 16 n=1 Tax=Zalerion maritima TaxID=339359 RepID=A0AAD5RJD2_9PEZI|nr:mediator of rna polymerase ii transcription subunit 16 [Zalerion maritima]